MEGVLKYIEADVSGPNLVIMAGVHGDEPCGLEAIDAVKESISLTNGTLTFVVGSPAAVAKGTREFQGNLNRFFRSDAELSVKETGVYEYLRSRELMPLLQSADGLLDLHSSSTVTTRPFIICEPQSYAVASWLPAEVVVSGVDELHPTGTDAFVNKTGGQGICIECGYHTDLQAVEVAKNAILSFLYAWGMLGDKEFTRHTQRYITAEWIYKNHSSFTLAKEYEEFAEVSAGCVIGVDGEEVVVAPHDGVILFPHNVTEPGSEAFLFGRS